MDDEQARDSMMVGELPMQLGKNRKRSSTRLRTQTARFSAPSKLGGLAGCALAAVLAMSTPALAQSASEKAAAEALFDDGVKLLKAGEYEQACKKLEKSQSVDPGIGTLLYLGECYKQSGRTASAWATFREAASKASAAGEADRARIGAQRASELEARLSYVTFEMPKGNLDIEGLRVLHGQVEVGRALWGTAVPVDPGEMSVTVQAPGYEALELTLTVQEGPSQAKVTIPRLRRDESAPEEPSPEAAGAGQTSAASRPEDEGGRPGQVRRTTGLVLGGFGLAGIGAGSVLGIVAMGKDSQADEVCGNTFCPDEESTKISKDAHLLGNLSTVGFAAGGALLVGGAVLYFTAPRARDSARIELRPTFGGGQLNFTRKF